MPEMQINSHVFSTLSFTLSAKANILFVCVCVYFSVCSGVDNGAFVFDYQLIKSLKGY